MNVDRMRRYSAGARENAERQDRVAWLDTLEPEHRARHEKGLGPMQVCGDCLYESLEPLRRMSQRISERAAAAEHTRAHPCS